MAYGRNGKELSLCDSKGARERERERERQREKAQVRRLKHTDGVRGRRGVVHLQRKQFVPHMAG